MEKNICVVAINCNIYAGGGRVMLGIADSARNHNVDYHTFSPKASGQKIQDHLFISNKYVNFLNRKAGQLSGNDSAFIKSGTKFLIKEIEKKNPDVIHLHGIHGWYLDYEMLFSFIKKKDIPIVWTQHDCWAFTGKCTYFTRANCYKWKNECHTCPQLKEYPESKIFDNSNRMFKYKKSIFENLNNVSIVTVSKWLEAEVRESFLNKHSIKTIENGVDMHIFKNKSNNLKKNYQLDHKIIILGVSASWTERKGLNDFIDLNKRMDREIYTIVLIGLNEEQKSICKKIGIICIDSINNREELANWYSASDVLFNPSLEETFGLVTVEAMACGLPVIVYNSTASPELVSGTLNYCLKPHDIDNVILSLKEIAKIDRSKIYESNIEKIKTNYNQESQYEKYVQLYKNILKRN